MGRQSKLGIFGMLKSKHPCTFVAGCVFGCTQFLGQNWEGRWRPSRHVLSLVYPSTDYPTGIFLSAFFSDYPLVNIQKAIEAMAIEIVYFSMNSMVIFHSYVKLPEGIPILMSPYVYHVYPILSTVFF